METGMASESVGDALALQRLDEMQVDPVTNHRFDTLLAAGYGRTAAAAIAVRRDIDLHFAEELVRVKGCDPEVAASILL